MQSPEPIDERYADLVRELRSLPGAPPGLRAVVLGRAAQAPEETGSRWKLKPPSIPFRMVVYATAGCAAGLAVAAIGYGVATSGSGGGSRSAAGSSRSGTPHARSAFPAQTVPAAVPGAAPAPSSTTFSAPGAASAGAPLSTFGGDAAAGQAVTLPPSRGRLANYTASMRLRVKDVSGLSRATRKAMEITRGLGGFVVTVRYGTPGADHGDSYLQVKVPAVHVQEAIVHFSRLGTILSQQISITDLQDQVNAQAVEIARLQDAIHNLQRELAGSLTAEARVEVENRLAAAQSQLRALTAQHSATVRSGQLSTISLELTTHRSSIVPVHHHRPGRIERAASRAADVVTLYGVVLIYALIVISPFAVLAAAGLAGRRIARRHGDERLLEHA